MRTTVAEPRHSDGNPANHDTLATVLHQKYPAIRIRRSTARRLFVEQKLKGRTARHDIRHATIKAREEFDHLLKITLECMDRMHTADWAMGYISNEHPDMRLVVTAPGTSGHSTYWLIANHKDYLEPYFPLAMRTTHE